MNILSRPFVPVLVLLWVPFLRRGCVPRLVDKVMVPHNSDVVDVGFMKGLLSGHWRILEDDSYEDLITRPPIEVLDHRRFDNVEDMIPH
jgi:hypothetical protein